VPTHHRADCCGDRNYIKPSRLGIGKKEVGGRWPSICPPWAHPVKPHLSSILKPLLVLNSRAVVTFTHRLTW